MHLIIAVGSEFRVDDLDYFYKKINLATNKLSSIELIRPGDTGVNEYTYRWFKKKWMQNHERFCRMQTFKPEYSKFESNKLGRREARRERNEMMVRAAEGLIAFYDGDDSDMLDLIRRARRWKLRVKVFLF